MLFAIHGRQIGSSKEGDFSYRVAAASQDLGRRERESRREIELGASVAVLGEKGVFRLLNGPRRVNVPTASNRQNNAFVRVSRPPCQAIPVPSSATSHTQVPFTNEPEGLNGGRATRRWAVVALTVATLFDYSGTTR